jgi:hypothetical protein
LKIFFLYIDLVLNAQLKRYTRFLATHKQALRRIEDALGSNITQTWDYDLNPVELKVRIAYLFKKKKEYLFIYLVFTLRTSSSS